MGGTRTRQQEMCRGFDAAARELGFTLDPAQERAVERLSRLGAEVGGSGVFRSPPRSIYLWGPVGRGKSWLLDVFFAAAPVRAKRRVHFHEFFRRLHEAVHRHTVHRHVMHRHRDADSAINSAVSELLADCDLLCFDEFHAHDVGDAMLITRLFSELFARRTVLVTTSNYPPDGLLPNPLYHHLFLPAIKMIKEEMDVVEVAGPIDYRGTAGAVAACGPSRDGFRSGAYLWPGKADQLQGVGLPMPKARERALLQVTGRALPALAVRGALVWFAFDDLCEGPTSALDVLALAERFTTWVIDGLPRLVTCSPDARQRLVNLVDVLCDRDVTLFLVGGVPLPDALGGEGLAVDIERTASRLSLLRQIG